jgi:hypothetical protein
LAESIGQIYNKNYSILFICEEFAFDCRKNEEIGIENIRREYYHIIVTIVNFKNANQDLITSLFNSNPSDSYKSITMPKSLEYMNKEIVEKSKLVISMFTFEYEKF